ncbi:MAG: hypothetical protein H6766_01925 [Candidatus Peribacteria bacterium]|nr:MAG: hypothetical protein H6766_01925 [Candidatus Peribacteria bacterium]
MRDSIVASLCTPTQRDVYQKTVSLIQANKDLISQKSINGVGDNEIMNEYIIHSLLQDIYNDIKSGAINPLIIKQYVESWNKIFREQYTVSSFTYDASYYLNQTLILPALNNTTLTNRLERSEINTLQADIKKLNDG